MKPHPDYPVIKLPICEEGADCFFLTRFNHRLEPHLSDKSLNINKITKLVGMSRTDLHRKMKEATGLSATGYIRQYRLNKALHLMRENPDWSVSQIASAVGFNGSGYFSMRFKEATGESPGKAARKILKQTFIIQT